MKQLRVTDGFILTSPKIIVSNVSPQWNLRLPEKNTMFRANPNTQTTPMM